MAIYTKTTNGWEEIGVSVVPECPEPEPPGLGSWAKLEGATGTPKRYEYPAGDPEWVAYEWTDTSKTHTLTTQDGGLVDVLLVGGGKAGNGSCNQDSTSASGHGGGVFAGKAFLEVDTEMTVGAGGLNGGKGYNTPGRLGGESLVGVYKSGTVSPSDDGVTSTITGSEITKAQKGPTASMTYANGKSGAANSGDGGQGAGRGNPSELRAGDGGSGIVVVRVPKDFDNIPSSDWVTRSNYFAVVENGVVTETYTEHHYGNGTVTPLPQTDLIPCDANVTEGYSYENGEFVSPAPDPAAVEEVIAELQAQIDALRQ